MIIPLGHRVIVKPEKLEDVDKTVASAKSVGIYIPETSERQEQIAVDKGVVVAIGDTAFKDFGGVPWCEVGDKVAYARYSGKLMKDTEDEVEYLILNDEDLICKFAVKG